jgi:cell surface protein SprA
VNYVPGCAREQLFNNNTLINQNEQSLFTCFWCGLEPGDSRAVFKNVSIDMRQLKIEDVLYMNHP